MSHDVIRYDIPPQISYHVGYEVASMVKYHMMDMRIRHDVIRYDISPYFPYAISYYAARKSSRNLAGVEPVHWKPANIHPGSLNSGTNRKVC